MFTEYHYLLSWAEIKKIYSGENWKEIKQFSAFKQMYITAICIFKALGRWQVWFSILFLVACMHLGHIIGEALGLKIGNFNLASFFGLLVGAFIYGTVMSHETTKRLKELMTSYNNLEEE